MSRCSGSSAAKTRKTSAPLSSSYSSEEAVIDGLFWNLPPEIISDILNRVSVKTLSRCRLVCKSWYLTIRNPSFILSYIDKSIHTSNDGNKGLIFQKTTTSELLLLDRDHQTFTLKLPPLQDLTPTDYSSNGLLLLISHKTGTPVTRYKDYYSYVVCNPITGDYVVVPRSPFFDESNCLTIGFGYDPVSKLCKLVRILSVYDILRRHVITKVERWDLGKRKWRLLDGNKFLTKSLYNLTDIHIPNAPLGGNGNIHIPNAPLGGNENNVPLDSIDLISSNFRPSVFVNGVIHWLGYMKNSSDMALVSFKLDAEEFYLSILPFSFNRPRNDLCSSERQPYLLVVRGCLSVVRIIGCHEYVEIWLMLDFGLYVIWEKKYVVSNVVMDNGVFMKGAYMPVEFMENGEILVVTSLGRKMGYYHPGTKVLKFLESIDLSAYYWRPLLHVCTLKSPRSISK